MLLKICGMKYMKNLEAVLQLKPDFVGFILYDRSPRGISVKDLESLRSIVPDDVHPVVVTVNYPLQELIAVCKQLNIHHVQLHGDEGLTYLESVKNSGLTVIKNVSISNRLPLSYLKQLTKFVDLLLFDTKGKYRGGNGIPFNHDILKKYPFTTPYMLSGGLTLELIQQMNLSHFPGLTGLDVNSGFEDKPGLKNISKLKKLVPLVKNG